MQSRYGNMSGSKGASLREPWKKSILISVFPSFLPPSRIRQSKIPIMQSIKWRICHLPFTIFFQNLSLCIVQVKFCLSNTEYSKKNLNHDPMKTRSSSVKCHIVGGSLEAASLHNPLFFWYFDEKLYLIWWIQSLLTQFLKFFLHFFNSTFLLFEKK